MRIVSDETWCNLTIHIPECTKYPTGGNALWEKPDIVSYQYGLQKFIFLQTMNISLRENSKLANMIQYCHAKI